RPQGGGRGGRVLAQAVCQAQLAVDRRNAALDRGDGGGGAEAAGRAPPGSGGVMALWVSDRPLVLASKSEVRRGVLAAAGIPLELAPADIDERGIAARAALSDPGEIAALLAREKARAIATRFPGCLVLGADQTLALGERVFSKPDDLDAARAQ